MKQLRYILIVILAVGIAACSTTRRISADDPLYTGLKKVEYVVADSVTFPDDLRDVLNEAVDVAPNKKWLYLFPMGLWAYNNWDNSKGLKKWLYNKFAQDPVLVSDVRPELRTRMLDEILDNNGYFRGTAQYQLVDTANPKKAKISYTITPGPEYLIDSIELPVDTCHMIHMIDSVARRDSYLKPGVRYCMDSLNQVRTRIANVLRNRGYYYFRPEYIEYLADSVMHPGSISLRMVLASNAPQFGTNRYRVGKITVRTDRNGGGGTPDTFDLGRGIELIQMMPSRLRHNVITESVLLRQGRYISVRGINTTQSFLSRLGIFSAINIEALPDTTAADPTLNVDIDCRFDTPLEASLEVNVSSKSNSYLGPGVQIGVTNHNIFGGGEQLNVSATGTYEWQTGHGSSSLFNSYEFGISGSLAFPRLLAPDFIPRRRSQLNWTRITLNADLLNRPDFFKLAQFNAGLSYDWRSSRYISNSLTLFRLTYTNLMQTTAEFDSIMDSNQAVALSFRSQYIPQMSYTFIYDRVLDSHNTLNWTTTLQEAGNAFWGIYELFGKHGEKELFGTPFSQFVKGQSQIVWGRRLGATQNWLVSRLAVGAAYAYGNSEQVPYTEQFYAGGANSIRAFTVRSIGPGSYHVASGGGNNYFDQTGTFKLEANVEWRFPIWSVLHGAAFVDAGNVWLLKPDPQRPGGELRARTFLNEIALGTGVGLRVDIGMLVLRGDLGIGIHAPYRTSRHTYYNMESFGKSLAFHLAIGYPF